MQRKYLKSFFDTSNKEQKANAVIAKNVNTNCSWQMN